MNSLNILKCVTPITIQLVNVAVFKVRMENIILGYLKRSTV